MVRSGATRMQEKVLVGVVSILSRDSLDQIAGFQDILAIEGKVAVLRDSNSGRFRGEHVNDWGKRN